MPRLIYVGYNVPVTMLKANSALLKVKKSVRCAADAGFVLSK